ncbi:hypothetical protein DFP73DRAFT_460772, partial [Morchella snyderi]
YNMVEKEFMMGIAAKVTVICCFCRKYSILTDSGNHIWVTVIEAVSVVGIPVPPMRMSWYAGVQKSGGVATFSYSPKGWTDSKLGMERLIEYFDKCTSNMLV